MTGSTIRRCTRSSPPALEGATGDELAALPLPDAYRAAYVRREDASMFEGVGLRATRTRASRSRRRGAPPRARARRGVRRGHGLVDQLQHRVDLDLRAAVDVRLPRPARPGVRLGRAPRARPPRVGSDASGVVLRVGSAVRHWRPGDKVTVHCNYVDDQDPTRPRRLHARGEPADLGVRDQLRRPRGRRGGEGQPADAKARRTSAGRRPPSTPCATRRPTGCSSRTTARRSPRATPCSSGARPAASAASRCSTC